MGKLTTLVAASSLAAWAIGCSSSAAIAPHVASAPEVGTATTSSATTTLATAISGAHEEKAEEPAPIPSACGSEGTMKDTKLCLPESSYAKKLCGGIYPEVALGLFGKGTPWTRVYLAGDVEAWNASGGLTHRAKLAFDEEVIVLGKHGSSSSGGIVMTGAQASYDVMRWDGTCVSVMEGELTTRKPPAPKPAVVPFSRLEETTRRALLSAPKVKTTHDALGKACSTVSTPNDKKTCEKADKAFTQAIVDVVRAGATLPAPARRP